MATRRVLALRRPLPFAISLFRFQLFPMYPYLLFLFQIFTAPCLPTYCQSLSPFISPESVLLNRCKIQIESSNSIFEYIGPGPSDKEKEKANTGHRHFQAHSSNADLNKEVNSVPRSGKIRCTASSAHLSCCGVSITAQPIRRLPVES